MTFRWHTLTLLFVLACSNSHSTSGIDGEAPDGGVPDGDADVARTDTGDGVCCPVSTFSGCSPRDEPSGGWARSFEECTTVSVFDGYPFHVRNDERGCPALVEDTSTRPCGFLPCEIASEVECFARPGCFPVYDDECCPVCGEVGACADCVNPVFERCADTFGETCGEACLGTPAWGCDASVTPDCSDATQTGTYACSEVGCVPAVGPVGSPELPAVCVPVTAQSCTSICEADPAECPEGTSPEADGTCFTGRCIPASICGR